MKKITVYFIDGTSLEFNGPAKEAEKLDHYLVFDRDIQVMRVGEFYIRMEYVKYVTIR